MKKFIFYFIIIINVSAVLNAQEKNCFSNKAFNLMSFEKKIDLENYKNKLINNEIINIDNDSLTSIFKVSGFSKKILNVKRFKKLKIEKTIAYSPETGFAEYLFFITYNIISNKYYVDGPNVYRELTLSDKGEIINTIDFEKGYKLCWEEAIAFCKKYVGAKTIKKYNLQEFKIEGRTNLNEKPNEKPIWYICPIAKRPDGSDYENHIGDKYYKKNKGNIHYNIDGVTGELLGRSLWWSDDGLVVKMKELK
jgi:hypothetical protein